MKILLCNKLEKIDFFLTISIRGYLKKFLHTWVSVYLKSGVDWEILFEFIKDREFVLGIDINHKSIVSLRTQYRGFSNLAFEQADITEEKTLQYDSFCFDTIVSINTLEHILNDELALKNSFKLLAPNGNLILIVPAHQWLYGTMDSSIGHYRRYSKNELHTKLQSLGFKVKKEKYINMIAAIGWFINGHIIKQRVPPKNQLRILNLVSPTLQKYEQSIKTPFGISLLSVAERE